MSLDSADDTRPDQRERPQNERASLIAGRDKPVFTNMRRHHASQAVPEFFTESLNTSYIPSPSPLKPAAAAAHNGKPRRAYRYARGGAALAPSRGGFRSEGSTERLSSAASSPVRSSARPSVPRSRTAEAARVSARGSPARPAIGRSQTSRNGTSTPSPQRGRSLSYLLSPASDASASSPPRGLAEAYRRIQDEEHLADQEEEEAEASDDGDAEENMEEDEGRVLQDITNGRDRHYLHSPSPESRRSSARVSPRLDLAAGGRSLHDELQEVGNLNRESRDSSPFEDITQEERQMSSRQDRDQERLKEALAGNTQPFKKARRRGRSGLTVDGLKRHDTSSQSGSSSVGSQSASSKLSDPSFNIPNGWGRKGRSGRTWLNRITEDASSVGGKAAPLKTTTPTETIDQTEEKSDQIDDWIHAAAADPMPTIESDSFEPDDTTNFPAPGPHLKVTPSFDQAQLRDPDDSLVGSTSRRGSETPPVRIRTAAIDAIRQREIQTLEKSALATNRLGELKEKKSLERVARRSSSNISLDKYHALGTQGLSEVNEVNMDKTSSKSETRASESVKEPLLELRNGVPLPNSPVVVFSRDSNEMAIGEGARSVDDGRQKPKEIEQDSMDILRSLARVTSASPSPEPATTNHRSRGEEESTAQPRQTSQRDQSRQLSDEKGNGEPVKASASIAETPQQSKQNYYLKTPIVTGAWIETPVPTVGRQHVPSEATIEESKELVDAALIKIGVEDLAKETFLVTKPAQSSIKLEDTAPSLPRSALASILERAKRQHARTSDGEADDTLQLEDSTIASLEELLANSDSDPSITSSQLSKLLALPTKSSDEASEEGRGTTSTSTKQSSTTDNIPFLTETQSYSQLASRLTHLKSSITDAKSGLGSLQKRLSEKAKTTSRSLSRGRDNSSKVNHHSSSYGGDAEDEDGGTECNEGGELHDFIWPCARCGCGGGDTGEDPSSSSSLYQWQTIRLPLPRLFRSTSTSTSSSSQPSSSSSFLSYVPTRTGWLILILILLTLTELLLWDAYSPPFYANSMQGFGVDVDSPRPPFVLAKVLLRGAWGMMGLRDVLEPVIWFAGALGRFGEEVFGFGGSGGGDGTEGEGWWGYREGVLGDILGGAGGGGGGGGGEDAGVGDGGWADDIVVG